MYTDIFYPSIQVMVATVRCEEIGNEKIASFTADEVTIACYAWFIDHWCMHALILNDLFIWRNGNN